MSRPPGSSGLPALTLHDHQSVQAIDLARLESLARAALPLVIVAPGPQAPALDVLEEIEVSFLDDAGIARIHGEFLDDPSPTDVITFHHGEILIGLEMAAREAAARGEPILRETLRYLVHGLLHLHGHTDADEADCVAMHRTQERILDAVWPA